MDHPYASAPARAFWKTGVGRREPDELGDLARPSRPLTPRDRVVTAGSCFAQHISRHLRESGYAFLDVEPAPPLLGPGHHARFGYGLFSARYGNVYTATQLRQLLERATGRRRPEVAAWEQNGRFYDPFRPAIEPDGFASRQELEESRDSHLGAVRRLFRRADVIVFTLGLTEAWRDSADGSVYPTCPGTIAGTFDPRRHEFVNFDHAEVLRDLRAVIRHTTARKPGLRYVLTVSPVPLTATASEEHVLVATTYSKAVLRAVAGQLAQEHDNVDYFPSYEIVTSSVAAGRYFAANRRTVTPEGVARVMETFFAEFCAPETSAAAAPPDAIGAGEVPEVDADAEVCEDLVLEQYAP